VEVGEGLLFKVDVQDPWDHEVLPIGEKVEVRFPIKTTLGIPPASLPQEGKGQAVKA